MNREIKFKIFANGKWYYKCLVGNTNNTEDYNWTCPLVWSDEKKDWLHCDSGVICQYTGFKDENGVEIYEGDIVEYWYSSVSGAASGTAIVKFYDGAFQLEDIDDSDDTALLYLAEYLEVIGNINENKELLNG